MAITFVPLVIVVSTALILYRLLQAILPKSTPYPLPPGPPGEPILGHLRVVPSDNPEFAYEKWSKEYGWCLPVSKIKIKRD